MDSELQEFLSVGWLLQRGQGHAEAPLGERLEIQTQSTLNQTGLICLIENLAELS